MSKTAMAVLAEVPSANKVCSSGNTRSSGSAQPWTAYSVLMSVYEKEKPEHLEAAVQSMLRQTVATDDFVIVCDGPLTAELDAVLEKYEAQNPSVLHLIRLPENIGTGAALNVGIAHCKNELIAKMDSDDISVCNRCERQLREFAKNDRLTVVG